MGAMIMELTYSKAKYQKAMLNIQSYFEDMASKMDARAVLVSFADQNDHMNLISYGLDVDAQFGGLIEASHLACQDGATTIPDIADNPQFSCHMESAKLADLNSYVGMPLKNCADETIGSFAVLRPNRNASANKFHAGDVHENTLPMLIETVSDLGLNTKTHQSGIPVCLAFPPRRRTQTVPAQWNSLSWLLYESRMLQ